MTFDASCFVRPVEGSPLMVMGSCESKGRESYLEVVGDLG